MVNKESLSDYDKQLLSDISKTKQTLNNKEKVSSELEKKQLKREALKLRAELGAQKLIYKNLGVEAKINKLTKKTQDKPSDRLSGKNKIRIFVLIFTALLFDLIQLTVGMLELVPVVGIIFVILEYVIMFVAFVVMLFFWRHYEVSFSEKYFSKRAVVPAFLKLFSMVFNFALEAIPFYPGITINTLMTIWLVRTIDKRKQKKARLEEIELRINAIDNKNARTAKLQQYF